ncbi:hypothetical protein AB9M62_11335 [Bacillales bacterium AN1005]
MSNGIARNVRKQVPKSSRQRIDFKEQLPKRINVKKEDFAGKFTCLLWGTCLFLVGFFTIKLPKGSME